MKVIVNITLEIEGADVSTVGALAAGVKDGCRAAGKITRWAERTQNEPRKRPEVATTARAQDAMDDEGNPDGMEAAADVNVDAALREHQLG